MSQKCMTQLNIQTGLVIQLKCMLAALLLYHACRRRHGAIKVGRYVKLNVPREPTDSDSDSFMHALRCMFICVLYL
jgi:hypothetical protein